MKKTFPFVVFGLMFFLATKPITFGDLNGCAKLDDIKKSECLNSFVDKSLKRGDLDQSFELVDKIYRNDAALSANCHDFVHLIGKKAFDSFANGGKFKVGLKTSYCAFGFYHGFMENLVAKSGDIHMARDFCDEVDKELSQDKINAKLACYHGIGHGWANVHDENLKGKEMEIVLPALSLCEKVTKDPHELQICATGVFDSISIAYYNNLNGLIIDKENPFRICKAQIDAYKTPCYMDMAPAILWLGEYDLEKSLVFVKYAENQYKDLETEAVAEGSVRFILRSKLDINQAIKTCRNLAGASKVSCIRGLGAGFLQFGALGEEADSAIGFCKSHLLTLEESKVCYERVLSDLNSTVPKNDYNKVCESLEAGVRDFCIE